MHVHSLETWQHNHDFAVIHEKGERRTLQVLIMTAVTMVVEIIAGVIFGSMALLADGWHMGTHVAAFLIALLAYRYAKRHENDPLFTFGTGKVSVLGGFTSAVTLAVVALVMSIESIQRIINPQQIHFNEAIGVAILGLFVNIICAYILQGRHDHSHGKHKQKHDHHHDHNLRAAYFHVLADALTSLLAIVALFSGKMFGWNHLDPVMGIVGALVITRWSYSLLKETGPILLDKNIEEKQRAEIKTKVESDSDNRIADLHLWKVGPNDYAVVISLVTHFPKAVEHYKGLLKDIHNLSHITIEVNQCIGESCVVPKPTTI
ncbi:MAG: CDF family Co(II)/Ni(II) efflux transporter DmeF [Proteobacteria bacterium]|nr:CDF family Co(II)/Ni(II) efflux transporter DmeF [Pseudomonadota bacterium]